jgi:DNA-binding response OmpR family regulator
MDARILVVEDDSSARMAIAALLKSAGYLVTESPDGETALELLRQGVYAKEPFDVVLADIRMRTVGGIEVLHVARRLSRPPEVIILTGYGTMETSIEALRAQAYDYLTKPCKPDELLRCVEGAVEHRMGELRKDDALQMITKAVAHLYDTVPLSEHDVPGNVQTTMSRADQNRFLHVGALSLDRFSHSASFNGQALHLTPIEYELLSCLTEARGRMVEYQEIARRTHGYAADNTEAQALLRTHIQNLRRKIPPDYFINVRGRGYRLVAPEERTDLDEEG